MNTSLVIDFQTTDPVNDDFLLAILLQKIQNGEEVAAEEFQIFLKKGRELISMLQKSLISFGLA